MASFIRTLLLAVTLLYLPGCGSNFDILGKGAKTECFYLSTDSLRIRYECDTKSLSSLTVALKNIEVGNDEVLFDTKFTGKTNEYSLPLDRQMLNSNTIEISMTITGTHWREMFYIRIEPGDLDKNRKIYSRYYGH